MGPLSARVLVAAWLWVQAAGPTSWTGLAPLQPLLIQPNADLGGRAVVAAASDPNRLAYCGPDAIELSQNGGEAWSSVSTNAVSGLAASTDYPLLQTPGAPSRCSGLALDPTDPATIYATFFSERAGSGGPPVFATAYYTWDGGETWAAVPLPPGVDAGQFGGFQVDDRRVLALFGGTESAVVEVTTDAGQSWQTQALPCPTVGACVRWGPSPNGLGACAMHSYPQPVLVSGDGGSTWFEPPGAGGADACRPAQLVSLSPSVVLLLVSATEEPRRPPARISHDGGLTWTLLDLPAGPRPAQLTLLPDGRLLAAPLADAQSGSGSLLLAPGVTKWCSLPDGLLPDAPIPLTAAGGSLWWRWWRADGGVASTPLAAITCTG